MSELRGRPDARGIPHPRNPNHVVPARVSDPTTGGHISDPTLSGFGIYIQPIRYPIVLKGD